MKGFLAQRPYLFSLLIIVLLGLWIGSAQFSHGEDASDVAEQDKAENIVPKVRFRTMQVQNIDRVITLFARTEPDRIVTIKAETIGRVSKFIAKHGERVKVGDAILHIDMQDRQQRLKSRQLMLKQRELEYEGAKSLSTKGFQNQVQLAQAATLLQDARAALSQLQLDIANTKIQVPFDGVFSQQYVDVGEYLAPGDPVVQIVDLDPLVIRADVTQEDIAELKMGQSAAIVFIDSNSSQGKIRYLSSVADPETNTFRIEVEISNGDYKLLAGKSAEMTIALEQSSAIFISPSLLSLNDKGVIGLKSVVKGKVVFSQINIVKTKADGIWVSGIGDATNIITVGQGFVRAGDAVEAVAEPIKE